MTSNSPSSFLSTRSALPVNRMLRRMARETGATYLDLWPLFLDAKGHLDARLGLGELAPETRLTHRNGYRPRAWETRVGEIELLIPKKRQGSSYFPSFLEPRRRSEQAIIAVVLISLLVDIVNALVDPRVRY